MTINFNPGPEYEKTVHFKKSVACKTAFTQIILNPSKEVRLTKQTNIQASNRAGKPKSKAELQTQIAFREYSFPFPSSPLSRDPNK